MQVIHPVDANSSHLAVGMQVNECYYVTQVIAFPIIYPVTLLLTVCYSLH